MNIGAKICEARKTPKLTQKQFAQLIGKTGQIVSNWERHNIRLELIMKML